MTAVKIITIILILSLTYILKKGKSAEEAQEEKGGIIDDYIRDNLTKKELEEIFNIKEEDKECKN